MTLVARLKKRIKNSLILFPLLAVLTTGCAASRHIRIEDAIPEIKSQRTTFFCDPVPTITPEGESWKVIFYAWHSGKSEPDEKIWYSQNQDYMEASKDCAEFYRIVDKRWEDYMGIQNKEVAQAMPGNHKHEQIDLDEIFPRTNPLYPFFKCQVKPVKINGIRHWGNKFYGWRKPNSEIREVDWSYVSPILNENYIQASEVCKKFYDLANKKWDAYKRANPQLFKDDKLIIKEILKTSNPH